MIKKLKKLTGCSDESLLSILMEQCKFFATDYCNLDEYSTALDSVVELMVCERFNKWKSEGISNRNYSEVSESYLED